MYSKRRRIHKRKTSRRKTHRRHRGGRTIRRSRQRTGGGLLDGLTGALGNTPNQHNPGLLQRAWSLGSIFSKPDEEK